MNIRKCFTVCAFFLALFVPLASHSAFTQKPTLEELAPADRNCAKKMFTAVEHLAKMAYVTLLHTEVVAFNDLMCTDPEWMGNAVVRVKGMKDGIQGEWYGIFHTHFLPDGTFQSATSLNMEGKIWIQFRSPAEWQNEWCGFIRTVYPEDFARQCN